MATLQNDLCRAAFNGDTTAAMALHDLLLDDKKPVPRSLKALDLSERDYLVILANGSSCRKERKKAARAIRLYKRIHKARVYEISDNYYRKQKELQRLSNELLRD